MKNIFIILSLISLLFIASSCPKNDGGSPNNKNPTLPPITQNGANTFGCDVNGQVWLPGGGGQPGIVPQYLKGEFHIGAQKSVFNSSNQPIIKQGIALDINPVYDTGIYYLKIAYPIVETGYNDYLTKTEYVIPIKDSLQNWTHITKLDSIKSIISGTFNMLLTSQNNDTVRITNGRFDVKYTN